MTNHPNLDTPLLAHDGTGAENDPFHSPDGTAGIGTALGRLAAARGGRLNLPCGRYDLTKAVTLDASSLCLSGDVWSCNTDPNGVFEPRHGTKLRMNGRDYPAIAIGKNSDPISGAIVKDLGVQGDIPGMDTRPLVDLSAPEKAAGLCLSAVRTDQCEFSKLSFCGLASGISATGNAEIDACIFEKINTDGCGIGFYFAPRASYYTHIRACIAADNPYYGVYVGKNNKSIHNLEIFDTHFVRNGGAFVDEDGLRPAAVLLDGISRSDVSRCLFDDPGTFWYYDDNAKINKERQPSHRKTVALYVIGNENRIRDNVFRHSSDDSIRIEGAGNVLLSNIADSHIRIRGENNTVVNAVFTTPDARLILEGAARDTTTVIGVPEERVVRV